ncbi:Six-bladed beta-propeller, TolB-like [Sergentomyia squamirostris]
MNNLLVVLSLVGALRSSQAQFQQTYQWKSVDFEWLPKPKDSYVGKYPYFIPENNNILGSGYHAKSGLMLVTIGRLREGIPSTLNAFCPGEYPSGSSPLLWSFPDQRTNTLLPSDYSNAHYAAKREVVDEDIPDKLRHKRPHYSVPDYRIMSVYHPTVDNVCDRLFVIDTGTIRTIDDTRYWSQRPAILVYDLPANGCSTRKFPLIRRVELPESVYSDPLGFDYIMVDYQSKGGCDEIFLYLDNIFDNSIVVYDWEKNDIWKFSNHSSMMPVPTESYVQDKYQLNYGVMNIGLGWPDKKGNRVAYYAPGASTGQYATTTKVLKNKKKALNTYPSNYDFRPIGYQGCKGTIHRQFFDETCGVMFFAHMALGAVRCWNVGNPFNPNYLSEVFRPKDFELFSDVYVDSEGYLWMHSCHVEIILGSSDPLDLSQVNARIRRIRVQDAIEGTMCENYGGTLPDEYAWSLVSE